MSDEEDKALTAAMLERMQDADRAIAFGHALSAALVEYAGNMPAFTVLVGMPDGTLTRFTNLEPQDSLMMVAGTLRAAMLSPDGEKTHIWTGTVQ